MMNKLGKIGISILIALIAPIITVMITFFGYFIFRQTTWLPFFILIIGIVGMYFTGIWMGKMVGIKNKPSTIWLGFFISLADILFALKVFPSFCDILGVGNELGKGLDYVAVNVLFIIGSGVLILVHIIWIIIWYFLRIKKALKK